MNKRNIIINSSALFIIATILQMTLHECGHFVAGILLNVRNPALFHNYASYDLSSVGLVSQICIAAAGPLTSLCIAIIFHLACKLYKRRNILFLFMLYMCVFGYICFFGYLAIAPIFGNGDTGFIFNALNFPLWLTILIALISIVALFILKRLSRYFIEMGTREIMETPQSRKDFADSLIQYPVYIGIGITTLLNLPVSVALSLIYPICSPFVLFRPHRYMEEGLFPAKESNPDFPQLEKIQPWILIALCAVITLNRILVMGFHWK